MFKAVATLVLMALLASCTTSRPSISRERIDRALAGAPGKAQPGKIVAREIEFARAARERGQWTAFREFAADGAILHGRDGPIEAESWLRSQKNPADAVRWSPRAVWMSCDASLAVSRGRFVDPNGKVGTFVTVWQLQGDGSHRWIYAAGALDDPQPPKARQAEQTEILVTAPELISGRVADCPKGSEKPGPAPLLVADADGARSDTRQSRDATLVWRWDHGFDGGRRFTAQYWSEGRWQTVVDQAWSAGEAG